MAVSYSNTTGSKGTSRLCWAARIVCLVPWIAAPLSALVAEATHRFMYETVSPFNLVFAFWVGFWALFFPGFLMWFPTTIAWRRHLLGGIMLTLSSSFTITCLFVVGWASALPYLLPVPMLILVGGLLHLAVSWQERAKKAS